MQYKKLQDAVLVSNYINGDQNAIEVLIIRHKQRVFSFIYSKILNKDTTEDIFQDTFIKVINTLKKGKYNEQGKFLPWVMRIAHNLIIDFFRKNKRMPKFNNTDEFDIFSVLSDGSLNAENQMINEQLYSSITALVEDLPDNQKEVLVMRIFKDMSFKEIAETTDVSINTALGRMRYALINMRKLIEDRNIILSA
jgi:RNA polymerase sigma-70 factor (ECF subfamily)